jgi:hypothetical protein
MPKDETETIVAREEQRKASKRATLDMLRSKKRAEREVNVLLPGSDEPVSFLFRAISRKDYDALMDEHPPTKVQQARGDSYNIDTFGPSLLGKVVVDPKIDEAEWAEFWKSPDWSAGEINGLFITAASLCNTGFEVVPTTGSG